MHKLACSDLGAWLMSDRTINKKRFQNAPSILARSALVVTYCISYKLYNYSLVIETQKHCNTEW